MLVTAETGPWAHGGSLYYSYFGKCLKFSINKKKNAKKVLESTLLKSFKFQAIKDY